jgi:hypothetical protein
MYAIIMVCITIVSGVPGKLDQALKIVTCMTKVLGSNLSRDTGYLNWGSKSFPSAPGEYLILEEYMFYLRPFQFIIYKHPVIRWYVGRVFFGGWDLSSR